MAVRTVTRRDVLRFRLGQHSLHRQPGTATVPTEVALLDYGVQDTGTGGAAWALSIRGLSSAGLGELCFAWTLRGAPHAYRRSDIAAVAVATAPLSEADAAKRIFDAAKPLRAAGIPVLDALRVVAGRLREIVRAPTVKGDASGRLTEMLDAAYLRSCRPCDTTHVYEMPFRLAALQAGLELEPGTSPPVLRRVSGLRPSLYRRLAVEADARFNAIRNHLRFYGPARVRDAAAFLDAPMKDVKAHWPSDAVEVVVTDTGLGGRPEPRFVLAGDLEALSAAGNQGLVRSVRLVGPYDPYLQLRDRELLVADEARRKDLWRVLGRPGAIVVDGEIAGTWRPSTSSGMLTVRTEWWRSLQPWERAAVDEQAELLAAHRNVVLAEVVER